MESKVKTGRESSELFNVLKSLETELIKTREKAEQSEKLKSAFLNNISHEIRTPLNGILGFLDLFNDDLTGNEREQFISIMRKSGERLLNTMNNIIEMSKLESGLIKLNSSTFEFKEALTEFNNNIRQEYSNSEVEYICTIKTEEEQTLVETDRQKMFQIFRHLIDNAFKFTKTGTIKLSVKQNKSTLIIELEDTGIGIKSEDRNLIFEPFRQVDYSLNRQFEGNGLGLSISKQLIRLMNGHITCVPSEKNGARFICIFPNVILPGNSEEFTTTVLFNSDNKLIKEEFIYTPIDYYDVPSFKSVLPKPDCQLTGS